MQELSASITKWIENYGKRFIVLAAFAFLIQCTNNDPAFSNLSLPGKSESYVAYKSPDLRLKPDTVHVTFDYNSSKITSITVMASLDSAQSWITIASITPDDGNSAAVSWIPGNEDSAHTAFFGFKEGIIRVTDADSIVYIESDPFKILGAIPFILTSPDGGETFKITDSISILYSQNQDLSANITVCAKTNDKVDWAQNIGNTIQLSKTLPIKNFSTTVLLQDLVTTYPDYFDFSQPMKILLADYGPNGKRVTSDDIFITQ